MTNDYKMIEKPKVLIIDDDVALCDSLSDIFVLENYLIETAYTAKDGIGKVEQDFYNIVLQDMKLTDSDGITVLEKIKEISPDTEVIMFTAYAVTESVIKAMDRGAFSYLPKPFEMADLRATLKKAYERQALLLENRKLFNQVLEGKNEWEVTFDSIEDPISIHDVDSNITRCNKALAAKLKVKPEDIIGLACNKVFRGSNEPLAACAILRCIETLKPTKEEAECLGGYFLLTCFPRFDKSGELNGIIHIARDITEQKQMEKALMRRMNIASLGAEIGVALTSIDTLQHMLNNCALSFFKNYNVAFVRIWTLNDKENMLELQASAGMYTHIDGTHSRVPVGSLKIGKIAEQCEPHITNNVMNDSWVSDKDWARRESMVAFVGLPLIVDNQLLGVLAMFSREQLTEGTVESLMYIAKEIALGIKRKIGEKIIEQHVDKLRTALDGTIVALSLTVEQRDPYTAGHQRRVSQLACAIADEMGLSHEQIEGVKMAGIVHDIGKMHIPAEILSRPGKLTADEFNIVRSHAQVGYDILKGIEFPWPVADIVHQHHEKMDGSGYPMGLSNGDILMEARILCVADVVEAMASHRPYRPSLGMDTALEEISKKKRSHFDERVVLACLKIIKEGFVFE